MKRVAALLMFAGASLMCAPGDLLARGPGGGGRGGGSFGGGARGGGGFGGGGGMAHPSPSAGRSPALAGPRAGARPGAMTPARPGAGAGTATRPVPGTRPGGPAPGTRPGGPGPGIAAGGRPSAGQLDRFLDIPGGAVGPGGRRPGAGGAAADFLQGETGRPAQVPSRPGARGGGIQKPGIDKPGIRKPGEAGERRQALANNRPDRIDNRQERRDNRQQRRDEVRNQIAENHPRLDFWSDHPGWAAWRITRPYRWASWGAITAWVGYGWTEPTVYSYGENVYYAGDQVYYGDQPVATAIQYAQQAEAIAASVPDTKPESSQWMPLGVFALTQDGQASGADPTLFMQLAVSKEGIIAGTLKNMATGQVQTLEGMADKASQRVAWGVAGRARPIIETGISNLAQDTAPALIHFADGQTQQWLLVRLPEPAQS